MKLWKKPRLAAALCAVVVLVCAAAPAVFLSVVDAASLGHSQAVADPYTAPTPTADDYYLLRQLSARHFGWRNAGVRREGRVWPGPGRFGRDRNFKGALFGRLAVSGCGRG